jgi:hypothetical protein
MAETSTKGDYDTTKITAVKSFIVQDPVQLKLFKAVIFAIS